MGLGVANAPARLLLRQSGPLAEVPEQQAEHLGGRLGLITGVHGSPRLYTTVHNLLVTLVTVRVRRNGERMELRDSLDPVPSWIPASGRALRHVGIHFDAVRAIGMLGEEIAYEVMQFTDFHAGPIVRSGVGERSMYFLVAPGAAARHRWPPGVEAMSRSARGEAFVGARVGRGDLAAGLAVAAHGGGPVRGCGAAARDGLAAGAGGCEVKE